MDAPLTAPFRRAARLCRAAAGSLLLAVAAAAAPDQPKSDDVIYPRPAATSTPAAAPAVAGRPDSGFNGTLLLLGVAAAATGGFLLWRQRRAPAGLSGRDARKLAIAETRSLGNRQYLVVADYDGRKFLLGVCPGRIDLLSPLDDRPSAPPS